MFDRELLKGSTSLIVLQLLFEEDMYGYQIVKEMEKRSENTLKIKEGTLYPALHKLEEQGCISSYWVEQAKGPARKYYQITTDGQKILDAKTKEWNVFTKVINRLLEKPL
ncbi:PadR family transcriptional regulator [Pseudogracilibacillus auburnensis]|uniref:PadR family transcriptional regulator PadR n=1 Tax=Pseudogracilibacillus auburnensis TaxID=1494959 RepID=A0A2V3VZP5_9BACI|nr:helix-turn-helix transcriptional regulator [Pseudogracilibacillus auburnensis]MBO1003001.1 helix-turn-helix transcriptional regulator [Pseudogracilibacillus auburnensis]PXW87100.1 PadR family transcriptional regulator PadR [Pseudogracilibacillus auburnensis]